MRKMSFILSIFIYASWSEKKQESNGINHIYYHNVYDEFIFIALF